MCTKQVSSNILTKAVAHEFCFKWLRGQNSMFSHLTTCVLILTHLSLLQKKNQPIWTYIHSDMVVKSACKFLLKLRKWISWKWRFWATKSFKYSFAFANDLNHCLFRDKTSVFQACNLPKWTKFPDFIRRRKPQFLKFPPYFFVFMMKVHRFTPSYGCFSHPRC